MHSSIEKVRRLLDTEWIARRMGMITKEMKEGFQGEVGVEYQFDKQAVEKKPATKLPEGKIDVLLCSEQFLLELLLVCEVKEWEQLFWNKFKAFLDQIGNDRVGEKERLTKEWRADCWKRLNPQMHAALKRLPDFEIRTDEIFWTDSPRQSVQKRWTSACQLFEGDDSERNSMTSLSSLKDFAPQNDEIRLRMKKEIQDSEFRLKRGSDLGRFDQFWDDDTLFECRHSRSKWLHLRPHAPLESYSHALKGNKNIIHITLNGCDSDSASDDVKRFQATISGLPWVTSISREPFELHWQPTLPAIHLDLLFIKSTDSNLITFVEKIRPELDPNSTYIFTDLDAGVSAMYQLPRLVNNARVLISFVAPTSGPIPILRLKHSGEYGLLEVTLGSTIIQLNPSSMSSLTIDDITLYPIQVPGPPESDHLSFEPGIRNDIVIQFRGTVEEHGYFLHDIEMLDESGLEYPRNILQPY